ncbi:MAG: tripartite tricarboxylate transporter substrate binding protein [Acetobacterales bacterium]
MAVAVAVGFGTAGLPAKAQEYPTKAIDMIVGLSAGGGVDNAARALAAAMQPYLNGQPAVVINKPGGSGVPAMKYVAQSEPDGYTVMVSSSGAAILGQLMRDRGIDMFSDFVQIGQITDNALAVFTHKDSGWDTPKKLVAAIEKAHAEGKKLRWGHAGRGSITFFTAVSWLIENDLLDKVQDVPFQGGSSARVALVGKQVDFSSAALTNLTGFETQINAVGIYSEERDPTRPDVKTLIEQGTPTIPMSNPVTVMGPKDMPKERVAILSEAIKKAVATDMYVKATQKNGQPAIYRDSEASTKLLEDRREKWTPVIEYIKKNMSQ